MKKYWHVINIGIQNNLTYRFNFLARSVFGLIPLIAILYVWKTIYSGNGSGSKVGDYTLAEMISYYLLTTRYSNNLIMNSDFEQGNTGFFTTYTYCNSYNCLFPLADYGYAVGTDASFFHVLFTGHDHTSGTGNFMIINGARPSLVVWRQTIQINPNTNYAFGVWISTMIARSTAQIRFSINGSQLGNIYYAPAVTNQWDQVFTTWNSGTASFRCYGNWKTHNFCRTYC